jgi:Mce-associated membrane protein
VSVDWYDLLDVPRDADTDTIRAAWKGAVADLDPTDKTFRVYSQAAEVLLDAEKRAAYDASLSAEEAASTAQSEDAAPAAADEPTPTRALQHRDRVLPAEADAEAVEGDPDWIDADWFEEDLAPGAEPAPEATSGAVPAKAAAWQPPLWMLIGLALLTVAIAGVAFWWRAQVSSDEEIVEATTSSQAAAEAAVVDVLAYDYRTLQQSHDDAVAHLTDDYRTQKYEPLFTVVEENAPEVKPVVTVKVVGSAVVRTGDGRARILLFINRQTTNKATTKPRTTYDQATLTMEEVDGTWLVDDIETSPGTG